LSLTLSSFIANAAHSPPSSSHLFPNIHSSTSETAAKSEMQIVNCLTELMKSSLQCSERELPNRKLSTAPPNQKTHIHKRMYIIAHTQVRKWKTDLLRATLGPVKAAASEPAGTWCAIMKELEKSNTTACYLTSPFFTVESMHVINSYCFPLLLYPYKGSQLPKHLRPEAESWKPAGHKQVKLPSVLEQVPNIQISGDWEHSSISDMQRKTSFIIFTDQIHENTFDFPFFP